MNQATNAHRVGLGNTDATAATRDHAIQTVQTGRHSAQPVLTGWL